MKILRHHKTYLVSDGDKNDGDKWSREEGYNVGMEVGL